MTTATFNLNYSVATDANYRLWVAGLITALTTVGLVQTFDTGQINTATVSAPATQNVSNGYAILRFDDTAQSTYPLFLKLEFGSQAHATASSGIPALWLTVGKGSDGAGVITNILFARRQLGNAAAGSSSSGTGTTTTYAGVASGGEDWVSLFPWMGLMAGANIGTSGHRSSYFHIERVNSGQGVVVCSTPPLSVATINFGILSATDTGALSAASPWVKVINYSSGAYTEGLVPVAIATDVNGTTLGASTSLAAGSIGPVFPWIVLVPGLAPTQLVSILSYPGGDAPGSSFASTLNGTSRNYYPIPLSDAHNNFGLGVVKATGGTSSISRYIGACIRWD